MNNGIRQWYAKNGYKVTWFILGWLVTCGLSNLLMGNFLGAIIDFGFAYLNYILNE